MSIIVANLYPPPATVDLGPIVDDTPPVFEPVNEYLVDEALINSYGYILKNFKVLNSIVSYRHRQSMNFASVFRNTMLKRRVIVERPAISIMNGWLDSYYHFTLESIVKLFILRKHLDNATVVFHDNADLKPFHHAWIRLLGLSDVTFIKNNEVLKTPLAVSCNFPSRDLNHHNMVIPEFRDWVLEKIDTSLPGKISDRRKLFIGRRARHRQLVNLEAVRTYLESRGYCYVELEDFSLEEQIIMFRDAESIVALHGASLTNLCFSSPGTRVLDLMHVDFKQLCFLKLSVILGIRYEILQCLGRSREDQSPGYGDIEAEIPRIQRYLDLEGI